MLSSFKNESGPVFRLRNKSVLTLSSIDTIASGPGFSAIKVEGGSLLNVTDTVAITSKNAPAITVKDSKLNLSGITRIAAQNESAISADDSSVIVSRVDILSGTIPVVAKGTCHLNLNRVGSYSATGPTNTSIQFISSNYGSLIVQNTPSVAGSIQALNTNVTLKNVGSVTTSGTSAAVVMNASTAKGTYSLNIEGPTTLRGTKALLLQNSVANFTGVSLAGTASIVDSVATFSNSYTTQLLKVTDSTVHGTRTSFSEIQPLRSHITTDNCVTTEMSPESSSVVGYHSSITGDVSSTVRSALWMHNSKIGGTVALSGGSSLVGSAANIAGSITADASFFGAYGGVYGTVTTSNLGLALAFGSSGGIIDGIAISPNNVLSAATDKLTLFADELRLDSANDMILTVGKDLKLDVGGNYSNTTTGTYLDSVGGTYTVNAGGVVTITGSPTVNI